MSKTSFALLCWVLITGVIVAGTASAGAIQVPAEVPYASEAAVPENIKTECTQLGEQISTFIKEYGDKEGLAIELSSDIDYGSAASALRIEITSAVSAGNAFTGHRKSMTVRVELLEGGASKAKTTLSRDSMGGMFGGYKGSCAVLGRITKALGRDVAEWIAKQ